MKKLNTDELLEKDPREFFHSEDEAISKQRERDAAHIQLLMMTTPDEGAESKKKEMIQEWLDSIEIKIKSQHLDEEVTVSSDLNSLLNNTLVLRLVTEINNLICETKILILIHYYKKRLNCKSGKKKYRRATLSQSSSIEKEVTVTIDAAPKEQVR